MKTARFAAPALLALLPLVTAACSGGADAASAEAGRVEIVADETETVPTDGGSCCATETSADAAATGGDACCAGEAAAEETPGCCK